MGSEMCIRDRCWCRAAFILWRARQIENRIANKTGDAVGDAIRPLVASLGPLKTGPVVGGSRSLPSVSLTSETNLVAGGAVAATGAAATGELFDRGYDLARHEEEGPHPYWGHMDGGTVAPLPPAEAAPELPEQTNPLSQEAPSKESPASRPSASRSVAPVFVPSWVDGGVAERTDSILFTFAGDISIMGNTGIVQIGFGNQAQQTIVSEGGMPASTYVASLPETVTDILSGTKKPYVPQPGGPDNEGPE